jgi:hypothetical protein
MKNLLSLLLIVLFFLVGVACNEKQELPGEEEQETTIMLIPGEVVTHGNTSYLIDPELWDEPIAIKVKEDGPSR